MSCKIISPTKQYLGVVVEPIIKMSLLKKIIIRKKLTALSLDPVKIAFKLRPKNKNRLPGKIILKEIEIRAEKLEGFYTTYSDIFIINKSDIINERITKHNLGVLFPYQGIWWIHAKVYAEPDNFDIETFQIQLINKVGRGWADDSNKNFIRMPICVIDSISFKLSLYTVMIFILTLFTLGASILAILLKNNR